MKTRTTMQTIASDDGSRAPTGVEVPLGLGWVAAIESRERGALLRLQNRQQGAVDVEIVLTSEGPVIRAAAAALEITAASDIVAKCDRFEIAARGSFSVHAADIECDARGTVRATGGAVTLTARTGEVAIRANDDVRVHGEQVLLNCDREAEPPTWVPRPPPPQKTLPPTSQLGDPGVWRDLDEG